MFPFFERMTRFFYDGIFPQLEWITIFQTRNILQETQLARTVKVPIKNKTLWYFLLASKTQKLAIPLSKAIGILGSA